MTTWQLRTVGTLARSPGPSDSDGGPAGVRSERHRTAVPPGGRPALSCPRAEGGRRDNGATQR
jgi:hypothetical protein